MSNFSALIATIQANIKTNGQEEITGAILQDVLEAIVQALGTEAINNLETSVSTLSGTVSGIEGKIPSAATSSNKLTDKAYVDEADTALANAIGAIEDAIENGYVYAGIATPSGTPVSGKVFYLAVTAGTYTNFGGLVVTQGVNILKNDGTAWSQEQLIGFDDEPTAGSNNLVKSRGLYKEIKPLKDSYINYDISYSYTYNYQENALQSPIKAGSILVNRSGPILWLKPTSGDNIKLLQKERVVIEKDIVGIICNNSGDSVLAVEGEIHSISERINRQNDTYTIEHTFSAQYEDFILLNPISAGSKILNQSGVVVYVYDEDGEYQTLRNGNSIIAEKNIVNIRSAATGSSVLEVTDVERTQRQEIKDTKECLIGYDSGKIINHFVSSYAYPQFNIEYPVSNEEFYCYIPYPKDVKIKTIYELDNNSDIITEYYPISSRFAKIRLSDGYVGKLRVLLAQLSEDSDVELIYGPKLGSLGDLYDLMSMPPMCSAKILCRVGCIGDSFTSGHIQIDDDPAVPSNPMFSWPHYMENLTGNRYTNFGVSGSTAELWVNSLFSSKGVASQGNKCQAYMIGLGINDYSSGKPAGSTSDFGTDNDTFINWYYKLVNLVIGVNADAKIFCSTLPEVYATAYNTAIRSLVAYMKSNGYNVYLLDLAKCSWYQQRLFRADNTHGHYTAIGYEYMAECYIRVISDLIKNNINEFQDVYRIDYDA